MISTKQRYYFCYKCLFVMIAIYFYYSIIMVVFIVVVNSRLWALEYVPV